MKIRVNGEKCDIGLADCLAKLPLNEEFIEFLVNITHGFATEEVRLTNAKMEELDLSSLALEYALGKIAEENNDLEVTVSVEEIYRARIYFCGPLFSVDPDECYDVSKEINLQDLVDAINGHYGKLIDKINEWRNSYLNGMFKAMFELAPKTWRNEMEEDDADGKVHLDGGVS